MFADSSMPGTVTNESSQAKPCPSSVMVEQDEYHGTPVVQDDAEDSADSTERASQAQWPSGTSSGDSVSPAMLASNGSDSNMKRPREEEGDIMSDEGRLEERRAKNRLSAHQSRLRKRSQLKYLQNQIVVLSDDNKKLQATNQSLVSQLAVTQTENTTLRAAQQDAMRLTQALRLAQAGQMPANGMGFMGFPAFPPYQG